MNFLTDYKNILINQDFLQFQKYFVVLK